MKSSVKQIIVWVGLIAFVVAGGFVFVRFVFPHPLAGVWIASGSVPVLEAKMILRKDGTGEFQIGGVGANAQAKQFRPFQWHTEGSFLFISPDQPNVAPNAQPYKLFDGNRYLAVNISEMNSLWRREEGP